MSGVKVRDVEMKIRPSDNIIISPQAAGNSNHQQNSLPTSIEVGKEIRICDPCRVCHYKGYTYVGKWNSTVVRYDKDGVVIQAFIRLDGYPCGIIAHEDRLCVLQLGTPYSINVFNLLGQQLFKWKLNDSATKDYLGRALAVLNNDELVVTDRTNKRFSIYSFTGELLRSVRCEEIGTDRFTLCHAGGDSIIVTNCEASHELFKFNLATGAVEWRSNSV